MSTEVYGRPLLRPNPWRGGALSSRRAPGAAVLVRVLGVAVFAAGVGSVAALSLPEGPTGKPVPVKDETRLPGPAMPQIGPEALISPAPIEPALRHASVPPDPFSPDAAAQPATMAALIALSPETLTRSEFSAWTVLPGVLETWREEEFEQVSAVDGRTLRAGNRRIRLSGLEMPAPEQVCRTLDGGLEPCWTRAAAQLELLTRWRHVICRYRPGTDSPGEAVGRCWVGSSDLAERMIRMGYGWQESEAAAAAGPQESVLPA